MEGLFASARSLASPSFFLVEQPDARVGAAGQGSRDDAKVQGRRIRFASLARAKKNGSALPLRTGGRAGLACLRLACAAAVGVYSM